MLLLIHHPCLAGFGMMGVEMAELALSWRRLQHRDRLLTNIITFFVLMGLFAFTMNGGAIDQLGHLGGLFCGATSAVAAASLLLLLAWCCSCSIGAAAGGFVLLLLLLLVGMNRNSGSYCFYRFVIGESVRSNVPGC